MDPIYESLGAHGLSRLNEFRCYRQGWDNGKGAAFSAASEKQFTTFIQEYADALSKVRPSVFLTREGNLQLGWEDKNGKAVGGRILSIPYPTFSLSHRTEQGTLRIENAKKLFSKHLISSVKWKMRSVPQKKKFSAQFVEPIGTGKNNRYSSTLFSGGNVSVSRLARSCRMTKS